MEAVAEMSMTGARGMEGNFSLWVENGRGVREQGGAQAGGEGGAQEGERRSCYRWWWCQWTRYKIFPPSVLADDMDLFNLAQVRMATLRARPLSPPTLTILQQLLLLPAQPGPHTARHVGHHGQPVQAPAQAVQGQALQAVVQSAGLQSVPIVNTSRSASATPAASAPPTAAAPTTVANSAPATATPKADTNTSISSSAHPMQLLMPQL